MNNESWVMICGGLLLQAFVQVLTHSPHLMVLWKGDERRIQLMHLLVHPYLWWLSLCGTSEPLSYQALRELSSSFVRLPLMTGLANDWDNIPFICQRCLSSLLSQSQHGKPIRGLCRDCVMWPRRIRGVSHVRVWQILRKRGGKQTVQWQYTI